MGNQDLQLKEGLGRALNLPTMTYLENFIGIKSLSTKQCPAELSPRIIPPVFPILTNNISSSLILLVAPTMYRLFYLFPQIYRFGETL